MNCPIALSRTPHPVCSREALYEIVIVPMRVTCCGRHAAMFRRRFRRRHVPFVAWKNLKRSSKLLEQQ